MFFSLYYTTTVFYIDEFTSQKDTDKIEELLQTYNNTTENW